MDTETQQGLKTKLCRKCRTVKPAASFWLDKSRGDGFAAYCISCRKMFYSNKPKSQEEQRTEWLKRKYKLTDEDYYSLLSEQDGKCAICKNAEYRLGRTGRLKPLSVDHNHSTGVVRGLLCHDCNMALGLMEENIKFLESMIEYLRRCNG